MTPRRRWARLAVWLGPAYLVAAVALACVMRAGDRWWPATLLLFAPRWLWLVPAPFALLGTLFAVRTAVRRASLTCAVAGAAVVLVAVMDLRVPWRAALAAAGRGAPLRVTTLNAGAQWLEPPEAVRAMLDSTDVLAVEECGMGSFEALAPPTGWHVRRDGMICLLSRFAIELDAELRVEGVDGGAARYRITVPEGPITVVALHLESPRDGLEAVRSSLWRGVPALEAVTSIRADQSRQFAQWARAASTGPLLVVGDFNMPVESALYRADWAWLDNAFDLAGWGLGSTKRTRLLGARIDHVLVGDGFVVDRCALGPPVGSDHLPITATLRRRAP